MITKTQKPNVGVVVGRFQVPILHPGHKEILNIVSNECSKVIIVIGVASAINTLRDPMDFRTRELMMRSSYPEFTVTAIKDQEDNDLWSQDLDKIVTSLINPNDTVMLYGGRDSFIKKYSGNFSTKELEPSVFYSGTEQREKLWDMSMDSVEFRSGIIRAAYSRFPTTFPTVDIAVFNEDMTKIILGSKLNDPINLWRLPGGFVDITDKTYADAAGREVKEELGLEAADYQYVTDMKVNDWRYDGQVDAKIHTTLFKAKYTFGIIRPGDDLCKAKWFDFNGKLLEDNLIVSTHIPLIKYLLFTESLLTETDEGLFTKEEIANAFK